MHVILFYHKNTFYAVFNGVIFQVGKNLDNFEKFPNIFSLQTLAFLAISSHIRTMLTGIDIMLVIKDH